MHWEWIGAGLWLLTNAIAYGKLIQKVNDIHAILKGNGQRGLLKRVEDIEDELRDRRHPAHRFSASAE